MDFTKLRSLGFNLKDPVQRRFVLLEFVLVMVTMVYLLYLVITTTDGAVFKANLADEVLLRAVVEEINQLLLVRISILFVIVFMIHAILGVFLLHRITGPLVRITRVLRSISEGVIPSDPVILRKGDLPNELNEALSDALREIRKWQNLRR